MNRRESIVIFAIVISSFILIVLFIYERMMEEGREKQSAKVKNYKHIDLLELLSISVEPPFSYIPRLKEAQVSIGMSIIYTIDAIASIQFLITSEKED